jgi:hypothetical protein
MSMTQQQRLLDVPFMTLSLRIAGRSTESSELENPSLKELDLMKSLKVRSERCMTTTAWCTLLSHGTVWILQRASTTISLTPKAI